MNNEVDVNTMLLNSEYDEIDFIEDNDLECAAAGIKLGSLYIEVPGI